MTNIKTRFAPSPTGSLHVGGARTALFNYCLAKKLGGAFLLRIEDTDRQRHQEEAVDKIQEDLRWMGIDWDEGLSIGGPAGPYRQSERLTIYREHIDRLLVEGKAYYAFDTTDELDAMREAAAADKRDFVYPRPATFPTLEDAEKARANGKPVVVRFANPGRDVTIVDEIFGDVTVPADKTDDFIIAKDDGWPTYHLANVVDDALMGVNFILRGQEFLGQSWRHKVLREAFGFDEPRYAHLPLIMDMQGRKLSKRDGDVEIESFRKAGYLPEAMVNFLALLGWNPGNDIEEFNLAELVELFDISRIGKSNAKFDREKLLAFNTSAIAAADPQTLLIRFKDFLGRNETSIPMDDDVLLEQILQACAGARLLSDIIDKVGPLFAPADAIEYDEKAVKKALRKGEPNGLAVLAAIGPELEQLEWTAEAIHNWMETYCREHELGMGKVAQPLRVALTGRTVSPGIVETLLFVGQAGVLDRITRCLNTFAE